MRARFLDLEEAQEISLDPESVMVATTLPEAHDPSCAGAPGDGGGLVPFLALAALLLRRPRAHRRTS